MPPMRSERGQVSAELTGLIAVAAATVFLLVTSSVPKTLADEVERLLCVMTGRYGCQVDPSLGIQAADPGAGGEREVYDAGNGSDLPGDIARGTNDPATGDAEVDGVHQNFALIHEYFSDRFGRDSYDDRGAPLIATVRYREDPDLPFRNAYWDPDRRQMVFGEGFAAPIDITAHEVTHALTDLTSDLEYEGESGALNEALSDIFAANLDPGDWEIGEDLPGGAIRDMANPERYGQPGHVDDYLVTDRDHGGVHTNSGIINRAYVSMVGDIGRSASEQIVYTAMTRYLDSDSGFEDFRAACLRAARERYGPDSPQVQGVDAAFRTVGLDGTWEAP